MFINKQTLNNSISVPKGKIHQYSMISHIQPKIELLIDNYQKSLKSVFLIKIIHNQINSCVHWQSNSLFIFTGLGDITMVTKKNKHSFGFFLVSDLLNHLNPVLVPRSVTYLLPSPSSHLCSLWEFSSAFLKDKQMKILTRNASQGRKLWPKACLIWFSFYIFSVMRMRSCRNPPPDSSVFLFQITLSLYFSQGTPVLKVAHTLMDGILPPSQFGYSNHSHSRVFLGHLEKEERQKNWTLRLLLN